MAPPRKIVAESSSSLFDEDAFATTLSKSLVTTNDTSKKRSIPDVGKALREVYATVGYKPLWIAPDGITEWAQSLLADLDSLRTDGIDPARYKVAQLSSAIASFKRGGDLSAAITFDTSCTRAWLLASHDLLLGIVSARRADSLWFHSNDSSWSGPADLCRASGEGGYPLLSKYRSSISIYTLLRAEWSRYAALSQDASLASLKAGVGKKVPDSVVTTIISKELPWVQSSDADTLPITAQYVRALQEHYGLPPTGKRDSITLRYLRLSTDTVLQMLSANLERLRWMPQQMEAQYVLVNIPQMQLFYHKPTGTAFDMRVVVGRPSRQTPSLNAPMANVVFSPSWGVPPTILKNDVLPGFSKSGASYLAKKGLRVYDRRGHQVSATALKKGHLRNYTLRQPPGVHNALGEVKFNLPNPWDIYLHDTPHREDFPKRYRAKSSGCVRVEKPREFAEFILRDIEGRDRFDQMMIDSIIQTRVTKYEILKTKIPVHIIYLTAFEDETSGHIRLLTDIYGRDKKLMGLLAGI